MADDAKHKNFKVELDEEVPTQDSVTSNVQRASQQVRTALEGLTPAEKREVALRTGLLPDQPTANELWRWLVASFCIIAVTSAVGIILIAFGIHVSSSASAQIPLAVFTATTGFLGGLFAKSPTGNGGR